MSTRNSLNDWDVSDSCTYKSKSFRVSICLRHYFSDVRARAFVLVRGAHRRRVHWLHRRLRTLFGLRNSFCLCVAGHLLPNDEPLCVLRTDEVVEVIPLTSTECNGKASAIEKISNNNYNTEGPSRVNMNSIPVCSATSDNSATDAMDSASAVFCNEKVNNYNPEQLSINNVDNAAVLTSAPNDQNGDFISEASCNEENKKKNNNCNTKQLSQDNTNGVALLTSATDDHSFLDTVNSLQTNNRNTEQLSKSDMEDATDFTSEPVNNSQMDASFSTPANHQPDCDEAALFKLKQNALELLDEQKWFTDAQTLAGHAECSSGNSQNVTVDDSMEAPPKRKRKRVRRRRQRSVTPLPLAAGLYPALSAPHSPSSPQISSAEPLASTPSAAVPFVSPSPTPAESLSGPAVSNQIPPSQEMSMQRDVAQNNDVCVRKPRIVHSLDY